MALGFQINQVKLKCNVKIEAILSEVVDVKNSILPKFLTSVHWFSISKTKKRCSIFHPLGHFCSHIQNLYLDLNLILAACLVVLLCNVCSMILNKRFFLCCLRNIS